MTHPTHAAFRATRELTGATVCHNGETFDVAAALDAGDGVAVIPTSQPVLIETLRALPFLEETDVPADVALEHLTKAQLVERATAAGIERASSATKADLIEALTTSTDDAA